MGFIVSSASDDTSILLLVTIISLLLEMVVMLIFPALPSPKVVLDIIVSVPASELISLISILFLASIPISPEAKILVKSPSLSVVIWLSWIVTSDGVSIFIAIEPSSSTISAPIPILPNLPSADISFVSRTIEFPAAPIAMSPASLEPVLLASTVDC